jgi:tellurite resistance protein
MDGEDPVISLPHEGPKQLAAAVRTALIDQEAQFTEGAAQTLSGDAYAAAARRFQATLEIGYLVASADGFANEERESLADLLEQVTGFAVDHHTLALHFKDLDAAVDQLGRRERLARLADQLTELGDVEQTIEAVVTIAMADGTLSVPEHAVLAELGGHIGLADDAVSTIIDGSANRLKKALADGGAR